MTATDLTQRVLGLPVEERRALVETVWESLEGEAARLPLHDWQKKLLDERLEEADRDPGVWVSSEEVEQEILLSPGSAPQFMKRWYHREARKELREAVFWYEDQRTGLGSEFLTAVRETVARIAENPRRFPVVYRDFRQAFVPRFPYLVFFVSRKDRLEIHSVFHTSRAPEIWRERLEGR